jgi:hypothetical protein
MKYNPFSPLLHKSDKVFMQRLFSNYDEKYHDTFVEMYRKLVEQKILCDHHIRIGAITTNEEIEKDQPKRIPPCIL